PQPGPGLFAGRRFVRVSARGGPGFPVQAMVEHGLMPRVALTVEEHATMAAVLEATQLVVLLPRHESEGACGGFPGSRVAELTWAGQSTPVALYTRREVSLSPAQRWFRSPVLKAVADEEYRANQD